MDSYTPLETPTRATTFTPLGVGGESVGRCRGEGRRRQRSVSAAHGRLMYGGRSINMENTRGVECEERGEAVVIVGRQV